jgi:hypothetical protein
MTVKQQVAILNKTSLVLLAIFLLLVVAELIAILLLNNNHFMFVLDDPYIHLALAENIWQGHYGVNIEEYSAPSSSIIWPFLIAPLAALNNATYYLLGINVIFSIAILLCFMRLIAYAQQGVNPKQSFLYVVSATSIFVLATNIVGLCFIGMEHSLQVLLAVLIALGLVAYIETQKIPVWFIVAIILAPLVRYENAIISALALLFLFSEKQYGKSILMGFVITCLLVAFSAFLLSIGLQYLPDSVLAKSDIAATGINKLRSNISNNFLVPNTPKALAMLFLAAWFVLALKNQALNTAQKKLSAIAALGLILHLLGGRIGWYFRYEMAIWAFSLMLFFYLYSAVIQHKTTQKVSRSLMAFIVLVAVFESAVVLITTPLAANNVYTQQYQMHRFITEVYQRPVAVNDLGWASYRNDDYVLDLWGLGSSEARKLRKTEKNAQWMDALAAEKNIELIMIYHNAAWFKEVPDNWIKVAELDNGGPKITAWYAVSFFVRDANHKALLTPMLKEFSLTLPKQSIIRYE